MEQSSLNPKRDANTPRIYVAPLSDYSNGRLYGRWIDADQPAESIRQQIAETRALSQEPSREQGGSDEEGNGGVEDVEILCHATSSEASQHDGGKANSPGSIASDGGRMPAGRQGA